MDGTRWGGELSLVKAQRRESLLHRHDTGSGGPLVFLMVLVSHALVVLLLIRAARQPISPQNDSSEPLVLLLLHDGARAAMSAMPRRRPEAPPPAPAPKLEPAPDDAISAPPQTAPPAIDWEHEAELAARNGVADAEKQKNYRDLSALSAEQLSWAKKNHMEPAAP